MASINYSQARKGMFIVEDGQLFLVIERELKTPGNLPSKLTLTVKNLKTGYVAKNRVHPEDKVEQAYLEKREMQYLYSEGDGFVFMDKETFDQITLSREWVGDLILYMKENDDAQVTFHDGNPVGMEPPATVALKVVETEPAIKGATAQTQYKPATLETGLKITVPPFIAIGEIVSVDTETGKYLGRAK